MPAGLKRYHGGGDLHFITCSCYGRQPLLGSRKRRDLFLEVLEDVRRRYQLVVVGYVVMPEHFHLLFSEPQERPFSTAMQALKLGFTCRVLGEQKRRRRTAQCDLFEHLPQRIWQSRYHDFNVRTGKKIAEKLHYMHRNPVKRGLVASSELRQWSSFRVYAFLEQGTVRVNEWGVLQLKRKNPTSFASAEIIGPDGQIETKTDTPMSRKSRDMGHPARNNCPKQPLPLAILPHQDCLR